MQANNLPLHTPLSGVGVNGFSFVAYQINGSEAENPMQGNILRFEPPTTSGRVIKLKHFFF